MLGYVPIDDMKLSFELDNSNKTNLEFTNKINNFDLKVTSNYKFLSEETDYNTNVTISNNF